MATLTTLLKRAALDPNVALDASAQRTIWELGARDVELRAALAYRPQLDSELRSEVAAFQAVEVRRAFMSRTDLTDDEIATLVSVETRSTVLVQVATETTSGELLATLSRKGGQRLQQAVALNPAADDDTRMRAGRKFLDRERHGRLSSAVQILLAECLPARRYALVESESVETLILGLPLLPVTEDVDASVVLARGLERVRASRFDPERAGRLGCALARVSWLADETFASELALALDEVKDSSRWTNWSVTDAVRTLAAGEAALRREFERVWEPVKLVRECSDAEQLRDANLSIHSWYAGGLHGTYGLLLALELLKNPATPLLLLRDALRQSPELRLRAKVPTRRSVRLDAALLASSYEVDEWLLAGVDVAAVTRAAAAESFWDPMLVGHLVASGRLGPQELAEIPLSALPETLPSEAVQALVAQLGQRTADPEWLEAALTLSSGFDGRFGDLISLVDCV